MLDLAIEKRLRGFRLQTQLTIGDEVAALYGPSGAGKSLTLLAIAGLFRPSSGTIRINGRTVFDSAAGIDMPPHHRRVGLVFQEYALFPHKTVLGNLAYGLPNGLPKQDARHKVEELLRLMQLTGLAGHYPHQLSGGQRQRVALGRALIGHPEVLLLDEPFSALDFAVRETLRQELLEIVSGYRGTILLVTHNLQEAYLMASTIAVIDAGKILQVGGREEVLHRPRTRRVAEHTAAKNILRGVASRNASGHWEILWRGHQLVADGQVPARPGEVEFCIRPEDIRLVWPEKVPERPNVLRGRIVNEIQRGLDYLLLVSIGEEGDAERYDLELRVEEHPRHHMMLHVGKEVFLSLPPDRLHVLAPDK